MENWLLLGGVFIWPIVLCSLLTVALAGERFYVFWSARIQYDAFIGRLRKDLRLCPLKRPDWLQDHKAPVERITSMYFDYIREPAPLREEAIKREGNRMLLDLERGLTPLGTIAQISPLLGLLGTVFGLVMSFYAIEQQGGQVQVSDMAGGIWEALTTTVAGLLVGILALLAHQYFSARVERTANRMSCIVSELDEMLLRHSNRSRSDAAKLPEFHAVKKPGEKEDGFHVR
jgi:biopolymer transport protein ExbB